MKDFTDLVSVLVPVYNRRDIIVETLSSALSQTYQNIEIVVVDNCSADGTWELISDLAKTDSRLRVFRNATNLGPVRNWLRCLQEAKGKYGKILWSDDLISPNFLEATLPFLKDEDVGFVFTATRVFSSNPNQGKLHHSIGASGVYSTESFIEGDIRGAGYPVSPGCALFRLQDLRDNLLLQIENSVGSDFSMHAIGNDLLLFLLVSNKYPKFAFVSDVLSFFRAHEGSISIASKNCKLPLHYNLSRAYFVEAVRPDLIRKLNAGLYLHLLRYPGSKEYGVHDISDFYVSNKNFSFSRIHMIQLFVRKVLRRFFV
ncbi:MULTISPECIES: glycosyltransferase family 2 protein [Pseudomonas]|uniref:Glycosyl transferase family 2 n=1 Tax=Pseudomonas extremaustralis TaxID=359110 RepID=A0A5C5QBU6_9PSED|nr:glycosyltransferase family 2 protein [Pseudomonas extremaustralis]TWS01551.1 glycosyltransferase family 2 protein [Pseudomonas extremaustralis]SDF40621.1 Glycosyl transferase family 2 [Pseudomonas extremaustralis]